MEPIRPHAPPRRPARPAAALGAALLLIAVASAASGEGFTPRVTTAPKDTVGAGTRGLDDDETVRMALLIAGGTGDASSNPAAAGGDLAPLAGALEGAGFSAEVKAGLDHREMWEALRAFRGAASAADLALVYFAGDAIATGGDLYLLPSGARPRSRADLDFEAIPLRLLTGRPGRERGEAIAVLSLCRQTLADEGGTRDDATPPPAFAVPAGAFVLYRWRGGAECARPRPNGPLADALAGELARRHADPASLFAAIGEAVRRAGAGGVSQAGATPRTAFGRIGGDG